MHQVYIVRKANFEDLPRILALYAGARAFMASRGNPDQWGTTHPPASLLEADIREGNLYVMIGGETIHGVFAFLLGEDPTYAAIYDGAWGQNAPYGTIHRIAGDGSGGIFAACVSFCRERCGYLRVDTHKDNLPMQRSILRAGFHKCGIIYLADGSSRIAFDRME